jgi:hypothetical protein
MMFPVNQRIRDIAAGWHLAHYGLSGAVGELRIRMGAVDDSRSVQFVAKLMSDMFQFKEQRAHCDLPCGYDCNHPDGCRLSHVDTLAAAMKEADPERDEDWDYRPDAEALIATGVFEKVI